MRGKKIFIIISTLGLVLAAVVGYFSYQQGYLKGYNVGYTSGKTVIQAPVNCVNRPTSTNFVGNPLRDIPSVP